MLQTSTEGGKISSMWRWWNILEILLDEKWILIKYLSNFQSELKVEKKFLGLLLVGVTIEL